MERTRSKTHLDDPRKKHAKPPYHRHPFACAFSAHRMAAADCNQIRQAEGSRVR